MDDRRFDLLARGLGYRSRRGMLRVLAAALTALLWLGPRARRVAAVCLEPGARCRKSSQCCSGHCRKKGRKRRKKCAPLPVKAYGCTIDDASCDDAVVSPTSCPAVPNGECRLTLKGRPVCAVNDEPADCTACNDNRDCSSGDLGVGAVCIRCEGCTSGTGCVCPFFVGNGD
jgi:hypothetical protein